MRDRLLRVADVVEKVGLSRTTIWRLGKLGDFPDPVAAHGSCIAWSEAEIDEWITRRKQYYRRPRLEFDFFDTSSRKGQ
jgi:prophage regulatory protein